MADKRFVPEPLVYERQGDTTTLRPQAQPVSNFVRPVEPTKSSMWEVAQALAEANPKINKFFEDKHRQAAREEARTAEAQAMVSTSKSWQEAIDKGEVEAGASPLYQRVYKETLGKVNGLQEAQAKVWQAWNDPANEIRASQNPDEIAGWFAKKRTEFLQGKDPDWVKGFAPAFNQ